MMVVVGLALAPLLVGTQSDLLDDADQQVVDFVVEDRRHLRVLAAVVVRQRLALCTSSSCSDTTYVQGGPNKHRCKKRSSKNKNVKKRIKRDKDKKTFVNVIKNVTSS